MKNVFIAGLVFLTSLMLTACQAELPKAGEGREEVKFEQLFSYQGKGIWSPAVNVQFGSHGVQMGKGIKIGRDVKIGNIKLKVFERKEMEVEFLDGFYVIHAIEGLALN